MVGKTAKITAFAVVALPSTKLFMLSPESSSASVLNGLLLRMLKYEVEDRKR